MLHQLLMYIDRYLTGRCSLREFETWLLANLQGILDSGDQAALEVANQVDADLVELGEGLIDEVTLRERLESYVRLKTTIRWSFSETEHPTVVTSTTNAETLMLDLRRVA